MKNIAKKTIMVLAILIGFNFETRVFATEVVPLYNVDGVQIATVYGDISSLVLPKEIVMYSIFDTIIDDFGSEFVSIVYSGAEKDISLEGVQIVLCDNLEKEYYRDGTFKGYVDENGEDVSMVIAESEFAYLELSEQNTFCIFGQAQSIAQEKMKKVKARKGVVSFNIGEHSYNVEYSVNPVSFESNQFYVVKGKSKKMKLTNCTTATNWKSTNKKVATINQQGKLKAKKQGWTYISAEIDGQEVGTVVNVVKNKNTIKMVNKAKYIFSHWKYSQAKRTKKGYFDCSSLVWRVYNQYQNISFGTPNWPGWTGSEYEWCKKNVKQIEQNNSKKAKRIRNKVRKWEDLTEAETKYYYKMQMNFYNKLYVGDIAFNTEKGPAEIYHVSTYAGIYFAGFDSDDEPIFYTDWIFGDSSKNVYYFRPMERKKK